MGLYLVSYDLHDASKETDLLQYLKAFGWARVTESSYAILTNKAPTDVVNDIKTITNNQTTVYVFSIIQPYGGYGSANVNDWLAKHVP